MRIGDWSSDVSSSDLRAGRSQGPDRRPPAGAAGGRPRSEGGLTMRFEVTGRTVFAATGGRPFDPALPALVFVHGAGMDHTVWTLQTRYFAYHGWSVLAVDLPGHGGSDGPALDSIEAMGEWVRVALAAEIGRGAGRERGGQNV